MQQMTPRTAALTAIATLGLVGALLTPAAAAKGTHDAPGQAKKADAAASTWTEDDDTNDGTPNNVADAGDDKHPSGKDRSVEPGRSGNQGKASSDPDDDGRGPDRSNGGPDEPNGTGGVDKADQDGNNGCGNDDDFEDDNEGWCGGKPSKAEATPAPEQPKAEKPSGTGKEKPSTERPGKPAKAEKPSKGENVHGKGTAAITVVADCTTVKVSSSKDISHVIVRFADGTSVKFDGLRGTTWGRSFSKQVASATAKSATTRATDTTACGSTSGGDTGGTTTTTAPCPAGMVDTNGSAAGGCATPGCPAGMIDGNGEAEGGCALPGSAEVPCPDGTVDANGSMPGGCTTPDGEELGSGVENEVAMPGGAEQPNGEVLGAGAERPSTVTARGAGAPVAAVLGGALAATGASVTVLLAAALLLLAVGFALVRTTRRRETVTGR